MKLLRYLQRNERGSALVGWVGMAAAVFGLVVAIWVAFYGPPGQVLKGTVQRAVTEYANGFEGGLGTSGPTGGTPRIDPVEPPGQQAPGQRGGWNVPGAPIGDQFVPSVPNSSDPTGAAPPGPRHWTDNLPPWLRALLNGPVITTPPPPPDGPLLTTPPPDPRGPWITLPHPTGTGR